MMIFHKIEYVNAILLLDGQVDLNHSLVFARSRKLFYDNEHRTSDAKELGKIIDRLIEEHRRANEG